MTMSITPDNSQQDMSNLQDAVSSLQRALQFYLNVGGSLSGTLPSPDVVNFIETNGGVVTATLTGGTLQFYVDGVAVSVA